MSIPSESRREVVTRLTEQSRGRLMRGDYPRLTREQKRNVPREWPKCHPDQTLDLAATENSDSIDDADPGRDHRLSPFCPRERVTALRASFWRLQNAAYFNPTTV